MADGTAERPILFSAPMIRGILAGQKSKTRRLAYLPPRIAMRIGDGPLEPIMTPSKWAEVKPGQRLWVREAFAVVNGCPVYRVDHEESAASGPRVDERWRPSIHMPRWASRITLEVTAVRVERLQDISEEDALAEGVVEFARSLKRYGDYEGLAYEDQVALLLDVYGGAVFAFQHLWETINGPDCWEANPEVAVISFRRVTP